MGETGLWHSTLLFVWAGILTFNIAGSAYSYQRRRSFLRFIVSKLFSDEAEGASFHRVAVQIPEVAGLLLL